MARRVVPIDSLSDEKRHERRQIHEKGEEAEEVTRWKKITNRIRGQGF